MSIINVASAIVAAAGLAIVGWFCISRPRAVAEWHNKHYRLRLISKDYFPTYLRFMGIVMWIFVLLLIYGLFERLA